MLPLRASFSAHTVLAGLMVTLVGYASSVAIVIQGLAAVGASQAQIASALVGLAIGKGLVGAGLSLWTRMPISIAWTTPGMALLATTGAMAGGFAEAVGAFIITGLLIVVAGTWETLGRWVAMIPKPIANAMLAGVILKLCLAPFVALSKLPLAAALVLVTWLVMMRLARLWAAPAAAVVAVLAMGFGGNGAGLPGFVWPTVEFVMPAFSLQALVSIALPLFLVTMASQNIPGYAVLGTYGYRPRMAPLLISTGAMSAATAVVGSPTINLAAITAALCAGPDAGPDPARRWSVAVVASLGYVACGLLAGVAVAIVTRSSPALIEAAAGLALIGALGGAMKGAIDEEPTRVAALVTFLVSASGLNVQGIGPAFWGLVIGLCVHGFLTIGRKAA
ncbi:MAG: benzoate/H(+) symporter BenE family transporter [Hyphomicrobiaceae bacterium]|nr:benzoate/H(+) symporter BenE family transporter [Hyphomicrobiaceae bacterium]